MKAINYPPDPYKEMREAARRLSNVKTMEQLEEFKDSLPSNILYDSQMIMACDYKEHDLTYSKTKEK